MLVAFSAGNAAPEHTDRENSFFPIITARESAIIATAPSNERKETQQWRELLNKGLSKILQKMRQDLSQSQEPFLVRHVQM